MVTFEPQKGAELSPEEKEALENAKKLPIIYDEDSPELTESMKRAFIRARRLKPYQASPVTLYLAPETLEKAKAMGADYLSILGGLLEQAVNNYQIPDNVR